MESIIIISFIILIVLSGLYLVYQGGLYLYETLTKKLSSGPMPANPETLHGPNFKGYLKEVFVELFQIGKKIIGNLIKATEPRHIKKTRRTLESWQTRTGPSSVSPSKPHRSPVGEINAYRPGYLKDSKDGTWKPAHIVNRRTSKTDEELWSALNDVISGSTKIHDRVWDTNFSDDDCDTWDVRMHRKYEERNTEFQEDNRDVRNTESLSGVTILSTDTESLSG